MPPRIPRGGMPPSAEGRSRAKKSARSEEAEPTPAQNKWEEREEKLRKAKERQEKYLENPPRLRDLEMVLFPHKRSAYPAHDDSPGNKRIKIGQGPKMRTLARRTPKAEKRRSKKSPPPSPSPSTLRPSSPLLLPLRPLSPVPSTPSPSLAVVDASNEFSKLTTELRDEILRYLLLWPHDIIVFNGWTRVFPRSRPRLDLSILYTCRMLRDQGLRILFGENRFTYDLRDPSASHDHTRPVLDKVFGNSVVPINEYGHLIRHVRVKVHRSRLHLDEHCLNFERAILKFLPDGDLARPVNLHTLTLEVPAVCNKDLELNSSTQEPDEVPICQYLREGSRVGDALFKIRTQWVRILAWDIFDECWETELDLRYFHKDEQMRLEYTALGENKKDRIIDVTNDQGTARDPGAATRYRSKDVEAMEERWDREVENAVAGLRELAWRIERLAIDPDMVVDKLRLWRPVTNPENRDSKSNGRDGFVSLPLNWREPPYRTDMRSSRGRIAPARCNQDINPNPGISAGSKTKSRAKSNTKTRTTTKTSLDHLSILNAGDAAKEAKLLEAQKDPREKETEPREDGMLTAAWLENIPEYGSEGAEGPVHGHEPETSIPEV